MENSKSTKKNDSQFFSRAARAEDDLSIRKIIRVPLTTRGVLLSFQREPSYFRASLVIYKNNDHSVVEDSQSKEIVACFSNGSRPCYVNGVLKEMRYSCDLRINPAYRGNVLNFLATRMRETMAEPNFSQNIIYHDNHIAKAAIQTGKFGMPDYYPEGDVETLTLTGFKSERKIQQFLSQQASSAQLKRITQCEAEAKHILLMNDFVKKMSAYYNYIPAYDFSELVQKQPYFQGLELKDFQLYFDGDHLVGMFGLWDQHSFKQTKIVGYDKVIGFARPFYNLYAQFSGGLSLPKKGQSMKYHVLHSLLCEPEFMALHHRMLKDAYALSLKKGIRNLSFTLSRKDPRLQLNQFYKGELITGTYAFVSFSGDPRGEMDPKLIPYFEVGRI